MLILSALKTFVIWNHVNNLVCQLSVKLKFKLVFWKKNQIAMVRLVEG